MLENLIPASGGSRAPAVAGQFYPGDPQTLRARVQSLLAGAAQLDDEQTEQPSASRQQQPAKGALPRAGVEPSAGLAQSPEPFPKAVIAPHAGYDASGPIAASAYAHLVAGHNVIHRVILLGPAHFVPFQGLAVTQASAFQTPLGAAPVDLEALEKIRSLPQVQILESAHRNEHSLEVHLPFLQVILGDFKLVPLLVGEATPGEVAEVLAALWGGPETCVVVSSDLSHYLDYPAAQQADARTAELIESLNWEELKADQACGCGPIRGLLLLARRRGLRCRTVDLRNSGDTCGMRSRVVGYGAFVLSLAADLQNPAVS
jgi:MEMO1 family protein